MLGPIKQWVSTIGVVMLLICGMAVSGATNPPNTQTTVDVRVLVTPAPYLSAEQVISLQLEALQTWQGERIDDALRQVWAFAHPRNKRITGPIQRFGAMLAGPGYAALIGHQSHTIQWLDEEPNSESKTATVFVRVLAQDGQFYGFVWQLAKVHISGDEVWMTTGVSPARLTGEKLSGSPASSLKKKGVCPLECPIAVRG